MKIVAVLTCIMLYGLTFISATDDELTKSMARGKDLYLESCVNCHLANGEGVKSIFPPLAKADFLVKYPEKAIQAIKFGMKGPVKVNGVVYDNAMPPAGFSDEEIADVMNYINNSFGNKNTKMLTAKFVATIKESK